MPPNHQKMKELQNMRSTYGHSSDTHRYSWFKKLPKNNLNISMFANQTQKKVYDEQQLILSIISKLTNSKIAHDTECDKQLFGSTGNRVNESGR